MDNPTHDSAATGPGPSAALDALVGYQLRRASAVFMTDFVEAFADVGLRPAQYAILLLVEAHPGISQTELSRRLAVKKANMAPLIVELERRGLTVRAGDPADRRVQLLSLTPAAGNLLRDWRARVTAHEAALLAQLSPGERATLLGLLGRLWV